MATTVGPVFQAACLTQVHASMREVTRRLRPLSPAAPSITFDECDGAELDIEATFRRQLAGLRRMRPSDRHHALRAARTERLTALAALRKRRREARQARRALQRLSRPLSPK